MPLPRWLLDPITRRQMLKSAGAGGIALLPLTLGIRRALALGRSVDETQDGQRQGTGSPSTVTGFVYDDRNGNGRRDEGEPGLPDVWVSNGLDLVRTDADGRYTLPIEDDRIVFVLKPRGWMTPVNDLNLPQFFHNHKPGGSPRSKFAGVAPTGPLPASVDFALRRRDESDKFDVLLFGDPQPFDISDVDKMAHDIVEEALGVPAAFGVSLGDIVHDNLALHEPLARAVSAIGLPWYNVMGNHDMNYHASEDRYADESFERMFGPSYYAFEYGPVSFLVLDDVMFVKETEYRCGLGDRQLTFAERFIDTLPKDRLLVILTHIPIQELPGDEKKRLFARLAPRAHNFVATAHYHYQEHVFFGRAEGYESDTPLHQLINVTACGSWWKGAPDENGLPHTTMRCGAPNGYTVASFDGNRYTLRFKAARRPDDHQMNIHVPDGLKAAESEAAELLVNVFAGSSKSTVEFRVGGAGEWRAMQPTKRHDPYFASLKELEGGKTPPNGKKLPDAMDSPHLWAAKLPAALKPGATLVEVRTMDMFGQVYTGRRVVRCV